MLTGFIITAFVCWIVGFFINGFSLYNVLLIVATEVLMLFFSLVWRCLFHKVHIIKLLLSILVRAVFLIICIYDDTVFVYVNEERKKI
jgi:hypothetical protein